MNRDKNLPLTETVYYVLLALYEPGHEAGGGVERRAGAAGGGDHVRGH